MAELEEPLAGRRIIVTRAEEQAGALADRLRALGAEPLVVPTIETAPLADPTPIVEAARTLAETDWLVFTSANGARYAGLFVAGAWPNGLPATLRVAAIGPGTAEALAEQGIAVDFVPPSHVAEALVETLPLEKGSRMLLLRADIARKMLAEGLAERGAVVRDVAAYHTRTVVDGARVREALSRHPDAITFTSSSTAEGFAQVLDGMPWPGGLKSIAIGPITADTLRRLGLPVDAVADPHTLDGLLDAVVGLYT